MICFQIIYGDFSLKGIEIATMPARFHVLNIRIQYWLCENSEVSNFVFLLAL